MAVNETWQVCHLGTPVRVEYLEGNYFSLDNNGNLFGAEVFNPDGSAASLTGNASATVVRSDGETVGPISGTVTENKAYAYIPQAALAVPGPIAITLKLTSENTVTTLACCVVVVYPTSTSTIVDPGTIIPDVTALINAINSAVASIPADYSALWQKLAPSFNPNKSGGYAVGEYVTYNSNLYCCKIAHTGSWNASHFTAVTVGGELRSIKMTIDGVIRNNIEEYNCYDVFDGLLTKATGSSNGITYTWDGDVCTVSAGTASNYSANVLLFPTALPDHVKPGDTFRIKYVTTDSKVLLRIIFRDANDNNIETKYFSESREVTIPAGAAKWTISLYVNINTVLSNNATVSVIKMFNTKSNKELENEVDTLKYNTESLAPKYNSGKKYVAFGCSTMWGAVWSPTPGTAYHRVKTEWQIPTRIALATGFINNFENLGVGGMGYIAKIGGQNIVDKIKAYDFSNVELVTITAGANDYAVEMGSADGAVADDGTICGAILSIIEYMKANYPLVQLVFMQCLPFGAASDVWYGYAGVDWSLDSYDYEVSRLCHSHGVGYVSWRGCTQLETWKERNIGYNVNVGPNYSHPIVDVDYCLLGDFISKRVAGYVCLGDSYHTTQPIKEENKQSTLVVDSVLNDSELQVIWRKGKYIASPSGAIMSAAAGSAVSVTNLIHIPRGAVAIITTPLATAKYALYDADGNIINIYQNVFGMNLVISSEDAAAFILQCGSATDSTLGAVKIKFEYADDIAHLSDITGETGFSSEYATKTGNPVFIDDASNSAVSVLGYSDSSSGEIIDLCGKNLFHFQHKSKLGMVQNGVTFHFNMTTQEMSIDSENGATGTALSATSTFDGGCTTLDGVAAYHNFHFRFNEDTEVTVTPNYSVDPFYDSKVLLFVIWVEDNTIKSLPIGYEGATIVAQAGVEYGIRVRVTEGFIGSLTLKPQVEIGGKSTVFEQYNGAECLLDSGEGSANVFNMTQKNRLSSTFASDKIIAEWLYATKEVKITTDVPASATVIYHPDYDGTVNGNLAKYIFKFTPGNVPVCVAGVPEELVDLAIIQIVDGTNTITIRTANPYLFVAEANKEYGYRIYVNAGSVFEYTFKPVISTGLEALKFFGSKFPVTNIYTDGSANLSVKYKKSIKREKETDATQIAEGVKNLTAGKIVHPFEKLKKFPPVITFIDDDTTNPTLVERFHDILAAENVVGNYAVEMRNVENYQDTMPDLLLGYEQEGFGMLYHCYKQDGDADRYWESGNPAYDEDLIRQNFYRGLRAYKEIGFNSARYWVTPYGVNDEFIRSLAKEADMECLLSCPTGTYSCNAIMNLGSNVSRWNMPRFIFLSNTNNDYQAKKLIDGCAESGGWLNIVTHVNSWPAGSVETNTQRLTELIQYAKAAGIEIWNFNRAFQTFKPLLMLNELF